MTNASVEVAIVVRDDLKGLQRLLLSLSRSVRHYDTQSWSILVILDRATQEFKEALLQSIPELKPLRLRFSDCNSGSIEACRRLALEKCERPWLVFLDSDCRVPKAWAKKLMDRLPQVNELSRVWAFGGPSLFRGLSAVDRSLSLLSQSFPSHRQRRRGENLTSVSNVKHIPTSFVVLRVSEIRRIGGFTDGFTKVGEDLALSTRIKRNRGQMLLFPELRILHAQRNSLTGAIRRIFRYGLAHGALLIQFPGPRISVSLLPAGIVLAVLPLPILFSSATNLSKLHFMLCDSLGGPVLGQGLFTAAFIFLSLVMAKQTVRLLLSSFFVFVYGFGTIFGAIGAMNWMVRE